MRDRLGFPLPGGIAREELVTATDRRIDGPADAPATLILAHGAGAGMDHPFMERLATGLAAAGWRVVRFEFPYMAKARLPGGNRGRPDPPNVLMATWRRAIEEVRSESGAAAPLLIGGKSMGGRIASMVADEMGVDGLVCIGYPFHPPGKPEKLRTAHLEKLATSALIIQGTRDPFGSFEEVAGYRLSPTMRFHWSEDGDHSLKPRKSSGRTEEQNLDEAVAAVSGVLARAADGSFRTQDGSPRASSLLP
jgi:uncharacterized protein